jgi:pSer/pThr/pTyr-binding forkhead associated (FHA) protein
MLRKQSIRLRETNKQLEQALKAAPSAPAAEPAPATAAAAAVPPGGSTQQTEAKAYLICPGTGNVFPVFANEVLIGRYDSVTGMRPDIDLTNEDQSRNVSRRHARLVLRDGQFFVAEEIGTMNGTFLNGRKLANGVLTPIHDGDELTLCRLPLNFKLPRPAAR